MGTIIALFISFSTITLTPKVLAIPNTKATVVTDDNSQNSTTCNTAGDDIMGM